MVGYSLTDELIDELIDEMVGYSIIEVLKDNIIR